MICKNCGAQIPEGQSACSECGALLVRPHRGTSFDMRQGRAEESVRQTQPQTSEPLLHGSRFGEEGAPIRPSDPRSRDGKRGGGRTVSPAVMEYERPRRQKIRRVNWAKVRLGVFMVLLLAVFGAFLYLKTTDNGQLILARLGYEADSTALWSLGTEYLDQGYIERSIEVYETAWQQDPNREDLYDKLLLLGEAYEAGGYQNKAEELYVMMYTDLDTASTVAYRNRIRLLTSQGRTAELADFLLFAYQKTGENSFNKQREEMLPAAPTIDPAGASYRISGALTKEVTLTSAEGYDIYYLLDGASTDTLPEAGTLYTGPLKLDEGFHTVRAVTITSELVSDEISANYTITLPVPEAPKSSLAPDDYQTRQRVWLRYNGEDADTITIYYTIDGQSPTSNSPIYTGDPIVLPGGRSIHIKAVAVNEYGKVSNEMDVEVGINIPFKRYFNDSDTFQDFTLLKTTRDAFVRTFGDPLSEEDIEDYMPGNCTLLRYDWGEARFYVGANGYTLYYFDSDSSSVVGPRSTRIGMHETTVTEKFRDMGQLNDQNGDRSIYWDASEGYAKLYKDDDTHTHIDYVNYTEDNGQVTLRYFLEDGVVTRMATWYEP